MDTNHFCRHSVIRKNDDDKHLIFNKSYQTTEKKTHNVQDFIYYFMYAI